MAGMLTVVNPRRRRRARRRRARTNARRAPRRRRRRAVRHVFANPVRRRRRRSHARRHNPRRRRRHHNPAFRMGGMVGTLTKGVALGAGAIGTNLATNGVNHLLGAHAINGPAKIALKAAVGLIGLPMVLKFVPGGSKFSSSVRLGAGIAIALDIYDQFIKHSVPAYLKDYQYGALNNYETGTLQGWAPQANLSGDVYGGGVYS